jgi:hypothetical protein
MPPTTAAMALFEPEFPTIFISYPFFRKVHEHCGVEIKNLRQFGNIGQSRLSQCCLDVTGTLSMRLVWHYRFR